jgi:hypothetical protein
MPPRHFMTTNPLLTPSVPAVRTRPLAITRNGRFVAFRQADGLHIVDSLGPSPRRCIDVEGGDALACVGEEVWWTDERGLLYRTDLVGTEQVSPITKPGEPIVSIIPSVDDTGALVEGEAHRWLISRGTTPSIVEIDSDSAVRVLAISGRRIVESAGTSAQIRTLGRRDAITLSKLEGIALTATFVLGGRAIAIWVRGATADALAVFAITGQLIHRITTPALATCAYAEDANLALAITGDTLNVFDLRYGRIRAACTVDRVIALDVDRLGRQVVFGTQGVDDSLGVSCLRYTELFDGRVIAIEPETDAPDDDSEAAQRPSELAVSTLTQSTPSCALADTRIEAPIAVSTPEPRAAFVPVLVPALDVEVSSDQVSPAIEIPDLLPIAFEPIAQITRTVAPNGVEPFEQASDHLTALLELVAARAALAIADGWHSGRISHDVQGGLPCEHEVLGLVGDGMSLATDAVRRARGRLAKRAEEVGTRALASLATGTTLPFIEIARDFKLSSIATQLLLAIAGPQLRGEIARLYGVLAGAAGRTRCDEHLLGLLLVSEHVDPDQIARELSADAPLVRAGLVRIDRDLDRTTLSIDEVLADRLRGHVREIEITAASTRRSADVAFDDVIAPADVKRQLVLALADRDERRPARVVIRGRRGAGRHTLIAALAARVGRTIAMIDVTRLPRTGTALASALRSELARAAIARAVPVVSGVEGLDASEGETHHLIREVVRAHPGPVVIRATPETELSIAPEHVAVTLPALGLGERASVWARALARHHLDRSELDTEVLSQRFRFGPGTIERVCVEVARRAARVGGEIARLLDEVARQNVAVRLGKVATRVEKLPDWNHVTLPDEMKDSVRELVGRARWQRTVYEDWGMGRRITTARGLTALFYGPPGTGKTLVAGLIARELGLELWRIDLARVTSKWVGETEKNLGEVFDAAEEGQIMLLFDEADSLFAKRTEVRTSNDRYANLEVNYLLQRLDSFEGVAVLTTNLEGSVDDAFKRRLSMRLYFPFPDEELRAELWAAHVPPEMPIEGDLDFADLARRFPLSGGYIRNSALRAAFLAAQEQRPLRHDHLVRAVQLEYRELGKLATSGRMQ